MNGARSARNVSRTCRYRHLSRAAVRSDYELHQYVQNVSISVPQLRNRPATLQGRYVTASSGGPNCILFHVYSESCIWVRQVHTTDL
jgi:hypothetical protein